MKTLVFCLLVIFLSTGCKKNEIGKSETEKTKTEVKDSVSKIEIKDTVPQKNPGEASNQTAIKNPDASDTVSEVKYGIKDIPKPVKYDGKIVASASWKDKNGFNILIITETKPRQVKEEKKNGKYTVQDALYSKELYGFQYIIRPDSTELVWKIQDFQKECDADLFLNYSKNSLSITDINKNGIAESVFTYYMGCISDVSPLEFKLMMHEGKDKYALRGHQLVVLKDIKPYGGDMSVDKSFDNSPAGFLDYAKKQWKKFQKQ